MSSSSPPGRRTPPIGEELPLSNQHSSPPQNPPTYGRGGKRERRNPSITPRKFNRFFTPRSLRSSNVSSFRQALHEISGPANSRNAPQSSPSQPFKSISGQENTPTAFPRDLKRRKLYQTPESSPEHKYLEDKQQEVGFMVMQDGESRGDPQNIPSSPCERIPRSSKNIQEEESPEPLKRIVQMEDRGISARLLQLSIGAPTRARQHLYYPVNDWQNETASFCSRPEDVHLTTGIEGPHRVIPFCATSCNTNSLVAIGDEEGRIRLLESDKDSKPSFADVYLAFRVHTNAIIDMVFSEDDSLLATASGDQTARVVDMATQTTFSVLAHHSASLKQVRFMPGSNSILATSSRDGGVKIWDLRCKGDDGPRHHFYAHVPNGPITTHAAARQPSWGRPINSIVDAHRYSSYSRLGRTDPSNDLPSRGEAPGRTGDMSVTAIQFLPQGQEHLLLTASEGDASVKLWDIRSIHNKRKEHIALSQTKQPQSHSQWRHFGISAINLNGTGTRLYTLCKDNTVYAYSTAHLILGSAPELSLDNPGRRLAPRETKEGLGPMYGFRHPQFHATSFYVKSAMRKAKDGQSELLAVGSSDGCAVLFPTDERYHLPSRQPRSRADNDEAAAAAPPRPSIRSVPRRAVSARGAAIENDIPMSTNGTPLIRGHDREVGNLCWTHGGGLITVGDDYLVRCWREDADEARDLRIAGETGGRRWACGWADVEPGFDEDDD